MLLLARMWCCAAPPGGSPPGKNGFNTEDALTVSPFKWALVGFMVFYMFLDGIQLTHPMSYLPDYFEDNGLSQTYVGANTFCLYLGNVVGMLFAPHLSHHFGNLVRVPQE